MKNLIIAVSLGLLGISAQAVDIAVPATDVHARLQQADQKMLFVDVRDPVEIMFVGFTDAVHVNVPFLMVDRSAWDERRGVYKLTQNPDFVRQIKAELEKRGLDMDAEVITLCRSGSERGEPSAAFLRANGFPNARYVINGFQGSAIKDGPQAGFRLVNGWQNSGLPWGMKMNPAKMYRVDNK
jgi:rhodanese-related sulfurtransferase